MTDKYKAPEISRFPTIDSSLDITDRAATIQARDSYGREQLVRAKEIEHLRNKLKWCYRREGVNHLQNCKHLTMAYIDILKVFLGFVLNLAADDMWMISLLYAYDMRMMCLSYVDDVLMICG